MGVAVRLCSTPFPAALALTDTLTPRRALWQVSQPDALHPPNGTGHHLKLFGRDLCMRWREEDAYHGGRGD